MIQLFDYLILSTLTVEQFNLLLELFADRCYENNPQIILKALIKLGHLSQVLELPLLDSGINKLFANKLVNHLFKGLYNLRTDAPISQNDLMSLIYVYDTNSAVLVDELKKTLLIDVQNSPLNLLPKLKACLAKPELFGGKIPPYIAQIEKYIPTEAQSDVVWNEVFAKIKQDAIVILDRQQSSGLFPTVLEDKENGLLKMLKDSDTKALLSWIKAHQVSPGRSGPIVDNSCHRSDLRSLPLN